MPFTPFHFGLGYGVAAVEQRPARFCFLAFVVTQVVIDVETLVNMIRGANRLHTYFHSFLGSLAAAAISFFLTYGIIWLGERVFAVLPSAIGGAFRRLRLFPDVWPTRFCVALSVFVGAWSHVVLDAIMHLDVWPFWPFSKWNPFLDLIEMGSLHLLCMALFIAGLGFTLRNREKAGLSFFSRFEKLKKWQKFVVLLFLAILLIFVQIRPHIKRAFERIYANDAYPPGAGDLNQDVLELHEMN